MKKSLLTILERTWYLKKKKKKKKKKKVMHCKEFPEIFYAMHNDKYLIFFKMRVTGGGGQ